MEKEKKKFEPFKTRPIRMSDKHWEQLKDKKAKSGKSWDLFIGQLVDKITI